ncbi:MAG TPA: hypothetical protein VI231_14935 [Candidatus Binatia bacterium]|jgi:hypothetical protein
MVSNSLDMELDELLRILKRMAKDSSYDAEYQKVRAELPSDWPL